MSRFHHDHESGYEIAFKDVIFSIAMVLGTLLVILLLLPHLPKDEESASERERGNIRVEIIWPDEMDVDIDLWGEAPDGPPVGYSNTNGVVLNLLRDDLGSYADLTGINYEIMTSRGLPPGEYTFNVHWYGNTSKQTSVPIKAFITLRYDDSTNSKSGSITLHTDAIVLTRQGEEITILRFKIGADGKLVPGSETTLKKPLRAAASPGVSVPPPRLGNQ